MVLHPMTSYTFQRCNALLQRYFLSKHQNIIFPTILCARNVSIFWFKAWVFLPRQKENEMFKKIFANNIMNRFLIDLNWYTRSWIHVIMLNHGNKRWLCSSQANVCDFNVAFQDRKNSLELISRLKKYSRTKYMRPIRWKVIC